MRFKRTKSNCSVCPLRDEERIWSTGPEDAEIILIGEAPGREEVKENEPFVGPAGRYLSWGLSYVGINRFRCWITNILPCKLPSNNWDSFEALEALNCCKPGLEDELSFITTKAKVIILFGNNVSHHFYIDEKISKSRGSVYKVKGLPAIPTYHPSYLNRMVGTFRKDGTKMFFKYVWLRDLKKAKEISEQEDYGEIKEDFNMFPILAEVYQFIDEAIKSKALIGVDIETTNLNPLKGQIVVIGLAINGSTAISIPFLKQGGDNYWSVREEKQVDTLLNDLFNNCPLMFQNTLFDISHLRRKYDISTNQISHDTMLLHHSISPELPHNLGFIVSLYGTTPYWKSPVLNRSSSLLDLPDETLRRYNLRDSVVLHQVTEGMLEEYEGSIYRNESLPLLGPVLEMQETGIKLDQSKLKAFVRKLKRNEAQYERQLKELGSLPDVFNLDSGDDLRYFLFSVPPRKFGRIQELPKKKKGTKVYQSLLDLQALRDGTRPIYLPPAFSGRKTKGNQVSTDKQGLLSLQLKVNQRINKINQFKRALSKEHQKEKEDALKLLKWLSIFTSYRKNQKLLTTYSSFKTDTDKRVRSSFLIHGTATGRLSSSNPNMQNVPIEVRKLFPSADQHTFIGADYSNLEVRILALETNDPVLLEDINNNINVHDQNTQVLFNVKKEDPNWEEARKAAKVFFFGTIAYGGGDREIFEKVSLEVPALSLSFEDFKSAKQRYMDAHPAYVRWRNNLEREITTSRRVENAFGRVRTLLGSDRDIVKEGINFPIQSAAASIINQSMIRIHNLKSDGVKLVLQIHDELVYESPDDSVSQTKRLIKAEMERPVNFRGTEVSFPVEISTAKNWGGLK